MFLNSNCNTTFSQLFKIIKDNWNVREYLDSPLYAIDFIEDYYNKDKHHLSEEDRTSMNNYIIALIDQFLGQFAITESVE